MKSLAFIACIYLAGNINAQNYYVYVTAESEDEVALVKFDGKEASTVKRIPVGVWPAEIEGPHGITVDPNGKFWYMSMAHGNPFGSLYKFETESDKLVGKIELGLFPASMQISKATGLLYVVNFNLHGDMIPSTISVVDPETMTELKQVTVGIMPHGSRISPDGMRQYSVGMMSGELFEINAATLQVSRVLELDKKMEMDHSKMDHGNTKKDMKEEGMKHSKVKPTWVIPHPVNDVVYVAGNGSNELLEIDTKKWEITHRMETGKGPYNVEISPDGKKLVCTYKSEGSTAIWDLKTRKEIAKIQNTRKVSHGVAISTDSKYAFVSVEGIGGDPGTVDIIDLETLKKVASTELGKQAGGIAFWKID